MIPSETYVIQICLNHLIETHDWKKRTDSLKRIQEIAVLFNDIANDESQISFQCYSTQIAKLYGPLTAQVFFKCVMVVDYGFKVSNSEGGWKSNSIACISNAGQHGIVSY